MSLGIRAHCPELVDREESSVFPHPDLPKENRSVTQSDEKRQRRKERKREQEQQTRSHDVEGALRQSRVRALVQVEHAHEPRSRQVRDGNPSVRVLVEMRQLDDPEPRLGRIEKTTERLEPIRAWSENNDVRA